MSLKFSDQTQYPERTRAQPRGLLISCACCVFRQGASAARAGVPRTGRPVQANSTILSCAVEIGQTESLRRAQSKAFTTKDTKDTKVYEGKPSRMKSCGLLGVLRGSRFVVSWSFAFCDGSAENLGESRRNPNHEALSYRFAVPAHPDSVQFRANEEVPDEEVCRPCPRQGLSAENLGRLVHPRPRQRRKVLRARARTLFSISPL